MKWFWPTCWIVSLAAAFGLARWTAPPPESPRATLETFRAALQDRDDLRRIRGISTFLDDLAPADLPEAIEALEQYRIGVAREEVRLLMLAWTRFDAPGAFGWALDYPTPWREVLASQALYAWGFRDGRAARVAWEGLKDPALKESSRQELVEGWIRSDDKLGAANFVATLPEARRRSRLGFLIAGEAMRGGVDAVVSWAEAVPEDAPNNFKQIAFYHAAGVVARHDPERAAAWFEAHRSRDYTVTTLRNVAQKWAQHHDVEPVLDWLAGLPPDVDETLRSEAVGEVVRVWVKKDPERAMAWLEAALPDAVLDAAVGDLARSLERRSPGEAIEWSERIVDDRERQKRLVRAARWWLRKDPEAARAWLAQSGLSAEERRTLLGRRADSREAPVAEPPAETSTP